MLRGEEPGEDLVVSLDGRPIGLVQRYRIADWAPDLVELARIVDVPPDAVGIDYLIGSTALQGVGLGPQLIAAILADTWTVYPAAPVVIVPVVAANRGSWRALEKAGFARIGAGPITPDNPVDDLLHFVYSIARPGSEDAG